MCRSEFRCVYVCVCICVCAIMIASEMLEFRSGVRRKSHEVVYKDRLAFPQERYASPHLRIAFLEQDSSLQPLDLFPKFPMAPRIVQVQQRPAPRVDETIQANEPCSLCEERGIECRFSARGGAAQCVGCSRRGPSCSHSPNRECL